MRELFLLTFYAFKAAAKNKQVPPPEFQIESRPECDIVLPPPHAAQEIVQDVPTAGVGVKSQIKMLSCPSLPETIHLVGKLCHIKAWISTVCCFDYPMQS